jgi:predicted ATPase
MDLELRPLNVLIGANGAGKSNLVSFFKMLNEMMAGRLQQYIATTGRAQSLLHFGPKVTPEIEARMEFKARPEVSDDHGIDAYTMHLVHAAGDTLAFTEETLLREDLSSSNAFGLGSGHQETRIGETADSRSAGMPIAQEMAKNLRHLLTRCRVYHFHDTSPTARVRQYGYIGDNRSLLPDAGNLAAFLLRLRNEHATAYQRILSTIRLIAPFFDDFGLDPRVFTGTGTSPDVTLDWRHKDSDQVFGPHQLSDGTLRAICLVTLLLQPENELPDLIIVDEPELGLHPYALNVVAALFKKASHHTQVLISTQSSSFIDNFEAEDVVVVNREGQESLFARPDSAALQIWLEEYSLGEVWEKNVIGGGPH